MTFMTSPYLFPIPPALTFLSASTPSSEEGAASSTQQSFDCPSDADFLVVIVAYQESIAINITGVTWNGVAMTQAVLASSSLFDANFIGAAIFYLAGPANGTHDVVASFDIDYDLAYLQAIALKGVKPSAPVDATNTYDYETDESLTPSQDAVSLATTTTAESTIRIGARIIAPGAPTSYTPGSGVTEVGDFADDADSGRVFVGYHIDSSAGEFDFACTTPAGSDVLTDAMAVAAFKAA